MSAIFVIGATMIDYYVRLALYYYKNRKYYLAGRALGRALHYVQDAVLPSLGKKFSSIHEDLENMIEEYVEGRRTDVPQSVHEIISRAVRDSAQLIERFQDMLRSSARAGDLTRALMKLRIAKSVAAGLLVLLNVMIYLAFGLGPAISAGFILVPLACGVLCYMPGDLKRRLEEAGLRKPEPPSGYEPALR